MISPASLMSMTSAEGTFGRPGMVMMSPHRTTTKPAPAGPKANKVSGAATRGKTVTLTISGSGFVAGTRVSGAAGTSVKISSLAKNKIVIKVTVKATAKKGTFSFKVSNANGSSSVRYTVK